ncbi:efflux RND transporter periplasmic adaptor subunit [Haliangium sp.]|uniref:efflux RND transporter periplasmic adaptor subunit n=1 Tax=Haliangium sp. TaxID=2663208 RepID=UPI003D0E1C9E
MHKCLTTPPRPALRRGLMRRYAGPLGILAIAASLGCQGEAVSNKIQLPDKPPVTQAKATPAGASEAALEAKSRDRDAAIRVTGSTAPHRTSQVAATGTGLVQKILVREGDYVKAGQVIARLDRSDVNLRIRQATVQRDAARVQLAAAQRELTRMEKLKADSAIPTAEIERAQTAHEGAQAQVEAAEVALAMAQKAFRDAEIRAPFAGLVVRRHKAEGEWVSTMPPSPIIELAEITPLDLRVDVPEHYLDELHVGDRVTAHLPALDRVVDHTITRIIPYVQPQARSFAIIVELPNEDRTIRPGVFAEVEIHLAEQNPSEETDEPHAAKKTKTAAREDGR